MNKNKEKNKSFQYNYKLINKPEEKIKQKHTLFPMFNKLEVKLRKTAQKKGILLPRKDEPRYAVLQR